MSGQAASRVRLRALVSGIAINALIGSASGARAEDNPPRHDFEVTAYGGYRFGGEFEHEIDENTTFELDEGNAAGLIFNFPAKHADTQWQAMYALESTELETQPTFASDARLDIDLEYLHFGGTYLFDGVDARPFVALTVGVTHFDAKGVESETYFSGSIGAGIQLQKTKRVGVRLEARAFTTLVDSDGALFCRTGLQARGCAISVDSTALVQFEASAGVVLRF